MKKVGFTGTQVGMTDIQKQTFKGLLESFNISEFHHGDCIGSDKQAHDMVRTFTIAKIHVHLPIDPRKRAFCKADVIYKPKRYLERNEGIVNAIDILIATPKSQTEELRSGTWATIQYARKKRKRTFIIIPDGRTVMVTSHGFTVL